MMERGSIRGTAVLCALALLMAGVGAAPSQAAPASHIFDPALSLTGGRFDQECPKNEADPIPDPGCPYPAPPDGPSEGFNKPSGIATDSYGDVYVVVEGPLEGGVATNPHVDVFDAEGFFLTEISVPREPRAAAVDSEGHLYVYTSKAGQSLVRYDPPPGGYNPAAGEIEYEASPTVVHPEGPFLASLAVNPENDHLFVNFGTYQERPGGRLSAIVEYGSAAEGNPLLDGDVAEVQGAFGTALGLAIDASRGRLYATDKEADAPGAEPPGVGQRLIRVFELAAPHDLIETFDGSSLPEGTFVKCGFTPETCERKLAIGVDEASGRVFAYDEEKKKVVYELDEHGQYLSTIEKSGLQPTLWVQITVDNGAHSPNGALDPEGRYLWLVDDPPGIGHAFAFRPTLVSAPEVEVSVGEVSEDEASLQARVNPGQADTTYRFEYTSLAQFEAAGFADVRIAGEGTIPAGTLPVPVSAEATALSPGVSYVFRVIAENEAGEGEDTGTFRTYPTISVAPCPNDAQRTGESAALPDCRAYELVTPPDTAGRPPLGIALSGISFPSLPAAPSGDRLSFRIANGLIPGLDATASLVGDPYLSSRGSDGWDTVATGADGTEAEQVVAGARSPDQTYSVWAAEGRGPALVDEERTVYVRYPDGHSELLGQGSLGTDPKAEPMLISPGGAHIIFTSIAHLEDQASEPGRVTVYDRNATGATRVVSLLPGNVPPPPGLFVTYRGSSLDGRGVAFGITEAGEEGVGTLYLRRDNQTTYEIGEKAIFEGIAEGGARIFYLANGNLKAFDAATGNTISFAGGGEVTVVNVSADGSTAYFVSPDKLTSSPNPLGEHAVAGEENLYRSRDGTISFVGTVSQRDVEGEVTNVGHNGLGLWVDAVGAHGGVKPGAFGIDPSRTTSGGGVLIFQSDADLTSYASEETRQIYRYDAAANELDCLSCNPTGIPPRGDALLQEVSEDDFKTEPNGAYDLVLNLSASGRRAFFQSPDPLVAADSDNLQDVYEWEGQGVGSCDGPGGCLYLVSSGHSGKVNYLYAASTSGDDVFFSTSDQLLPTDKEAVPSIYDARVGGGFVEDPVSAGCEGEACRPALTQTPSLTMPGSALAGPGNVRKKCPKGKRRVKRAGKVRCVKKHRHRHRHHRRHAGQSKRRGRK